MSLKFLTKYKYAITYGLSLAILLAFLKWLELRFIIVNHAFEVYIGFIAVIFTALGIWLALKLSKPKVETRIETVIIEKEIYRSEADTAGASFEFNEAEREKLSLSKRELEVLQLMSEGLSNQEIAGRLFLSLNTIKTHSSNVFEKLDVKRRIQAVEKAKRLKLIH